MMIRRYIVKDMPEAVVHIRRELGKDAVILSSKRITLKKWLGLWRYKRLEVVAATGDDVPVRVRGVDTHPKAQQRPQPTQSLQVPAIPSPLEDVQKQIEDMKRLLERVVVAAPGVRPPLVHQLIRQGLNEEHVSRLMESFTATRTPVGGEGTGEPWTSGKQHDLFVQHVLRDMEAQVEAQPIAPTSRVVALVGPTGVGKSTTIAKLAALHVLAGNRKVGLLTTDTYRIAAVDQLKTYADILNIPLEVVYKTSDIPGALERLADRDLTLLDTAGRNFRVERHVEELRHWLQQISVDETYLVLALTSKTEDLDAIAAAFERVPVDKFLFTKLDETTTYGAILNLLYSYRKPLSYLTTGQNVPDDIEVASLEKILRLMIGGAA
jgi:flagellar biosynthesis protein FlhF